MASFTPSKYLYCGCEKPTLDDDDECDCDCGGVWRTENVELQLNRDVGCSQGGLGKPLDIFLKKEARLPSGETFGQSFTFCFIKDFEHFLSSIASNIMWEGDATEKKLLLTCLEETLKKHKK